MIQGPLKSPDDVISHIIFSEYYVIYLVRAKLVFSKLANIGTVFWATVVDREPVFESAQLTGGEQVSGEW